MPKDICECCGTENAWTWEEAFEKFGFNDGDGLVMTETVADEIRSTGYQVTTQCFGLHNVVIVSITMDGIEQLPLDRIQLGYDSPRNYLPELIVRHLDEQFSDTE